MTLSDIITRLEKATGPSATLDTLIAQAISADGWPAYTSSIDSALTLVTEDFYWELARVTEVPGSAVQCFWAQCYSDEAISEHGGSDSPAIALCIAALKAREAK